MNLIREFLAFLKEVFIESWRLVFTFLDVIGIAIFFAPHLAQNLTDDEAAARAMGGIIFFVSFLLANFTLYRKSALMIQSLNKDSFLFYKYHDLPDDIEMKYTGPELAKDLEVWLVYKDMNREQRNDRVEQFFSRDDPKMTGTPFRPNFLDPGDVVRFRVPTELQTLGDKVTVRIVAVGAKSKKSVVVEREFELTQLTV